MGRPKKIQTDVIPFTDRKSDVIEKMTLNEYLSNYSCNHELDKIFSMWFLKKATDVKIKSKSEWDDLIQSFLSCNENQ